MADPGDHALFVPVAELTALRRRIEERLGVPHPPRGPDAVGRWVEQRIDGKALVADVPTLRLQPGWSLRAYVHRIHGNGSGVVWALPPNTADPPPPATVGGSPWEPPRPFGARPFSQALEGDRSLLSYLHASLLLREVAEYGALWHGASWGDHVLVDALPTDEPWTLEGLVPRRLMPRVQREGEDVIVTFWTYCPVETIRLTVHVDRYTGGGYQPTCTAKVVATAGFGGVH